MENISVLFCFCCSDFSSPSSLMSLACFSVGFCSFFIFCPHDITDGQKLSERDAVGRGFSDQRELGIVTLELFSIFFKPII